MRLDVSSREPLFGDLDIDAHVRAVPDGHSIKGLFVASNAAILAPADWSSFEAKLIAPPRGGKYLTFTDYPLGDYLRVTDAAARKRYPKVGAREAHRLLSRLTFETFGASTLGRVTLSMLNGPASALTKYQEIYNRLVTGSRVTVRVVEPNLVEAEFKGYYSTREAIYGVLEGTVLAYRKEPTVILNVMGKGHYVAQVRWSA